MIALILIAFISFSYSIDYWNGSVDGVDYWNEERKSFEKGKELYKVFEESRKWFPENVSPIERYFYEHPDDPLAWEYLYRYYEERTERANALQAVILLKQAEEDIKLRKILSNLEVLYFYSPDCPYCRATEPLIGKLSEITTVYRINVNNPKNFPYIRKFNVIGTPTMVFVKKGTEREVGRWFGLAFWGRNFKEFLRGVMRD